MSDLCLTDWWVGKLIYSPSPSFYVDSARLYSKYVLGLKTYSTEYAKRFKHEAKTNLLPYKNIVHNNIMSHLLITKMTDV